VVAGFTVSPLSLHSILVMRFDDHGVLDSSFGSGGMVVVSLGSGGSQAAAVAIQSDGRIVVGGFAYRNEDINDGLRNADFAVVRFTATGAPDPTFGNAGVAYTDLGGPFTVENLSGLALQPDGKIVAVGQTSDTSGSSSLLSMVRYLPDGTLDAGFGAAGKVLTSLGVGPFDYGRAVVLQPDGKIVVAGGSESNFAIARYQPTGFLDVSFGNAGKVVVPNPLL